MAGTKRERDLARQKAARQQRDIAQKDDRRRRFILVGSIIGGLIAVIATLVVVVVATNGSSPSSNDASSPSPTGKSAVPPASTAEAAKVKCTGLDNQKPTTKQYSGYSAKLVPGGTYIETMTTNCGPIVFSMNAVRAPQTTEAVGYLSDLAKFYNGTVCHRLSLEDPWIIQCGDPTGTGRGGPGFTIPDENLPPSKNGIATYPRGTVAMANSGPNTNGSQFFIVYKDSPLPPSYTVLGQVTSGMDIIDHIAAGGTADGSADGRPKRPLEIKKMISSVSYPVNAGQ